MKTVVSAAAAILLAWSSLAAAETIQEDGVRVSVAGRMSPSRLPREKAVPVAISVAGHIVATRAGALPKLDRISFAINSHGQLKLGKTPVCRLGRIDPSTTAEALAACRSSLVGEGRFTADVKIPEQSPFPSEGKLLAFNGRLRGKPALLAHIYGTEPVPTSYVLPFAIKASHGTYGTVLEASLPRVTGEWGYVTGVKLDFQPRFLSASCPAPHGFALAAFPLLRSSFSFDDGAALTSTLIRHCTVRG